MEMNTKFYRIVFFLMALSLLSAACGPTSAGTAGTGGGVRAWFDAPLPETVILPPNPCQIVAHGSSPNGIVTFELSVNGAVSASIPSPDTKNSLVTLTQACGLSEPGKYLLQLRARDHAGAWSNYAETSLIIPDRLATEPPLKIEDGPTVTSVPTGNVGGAVFTDQNGNGLQDPAEGPLDGVTVTLKGCGPDATQVTVADGIFQFANVPAGSCTLEVSKAGWGFSGSIPNLGYPLPVGSNPELPTNVGILMAPMSDNLPEPNFGAPALSSNLVYFGGRCDPSQLTVQIQAQHPDGIKVLVFFHRLHELNGNKDSGWSEGFSMNPGSDDIYMLSTSGDRLAQASGFTVQAIASYQFVLQTQKGEFIRSPVYSDLQVVPCGSAPRPEPGITVTPGIIIIPGLVIPTPTFPVIH